MDVEIDKIRSSPFQPRLVFNVEDLKEEIQKDGLLSPLIIREVDGYYELVDGERRLRALKALGWKNVPVEIRKVDDRIARLSVYKLNTIRTGYSVEEEARYFKKLADGGMKPYEIETELGVKHSWVQACLNVWQFPEDIRDNIFAPRGKTAYQVYMSDIRDLEGVINRNIDEAVAILREIIEKRMTVGEKQRLITDRARKIDEVRIKAVEEALPKIMPEVSRLETPEDLENAASAMRREAERRRMQEMTPEEKADLEAERRRKLETQRRDAEERKRREETERKRREEEDRKRIEEAVDTRARKQVEIERSQLEKEIRKKTREELMHDQEFRRQVAETVTIPRREPKGELAVKEGTVYTIGELDCDRCKKHYVIKCDGKRNWLE